MGSPGDVAVTRIESEARECRIHVGLSPTTFLLFVCRCLQSRVKAKCQMLTLTNTNPTVPKFSSCFSFFMPQSMPLVALSAMRWNNGALWKKTRFCSTSFNNARMKFAWWAQRGKARRENTSRVTCFKKQHNYFLFVSLHECTSKE